MSRYFALSSHAQMPTRIFSKMSTGPVQPSTVNGCPPKRQNIPPAMAWPKKDSNTPCIPLVVSSRKPPKVMALVMVAR